MAHDRETDLPGEMLCSYERVGQMSNEPLVTDRANTVIYPPVKEHMPIEEWREYKGGADGLFIELHSFEGVEFLSVRGEVVETWPSGLIQTLFVCDGREYAVVVDGTRQDPFHARNDPVVVQEVFEGSWSGTVFLPQTGR